MYSSEFPVILFLSQSNDMHCLQSTDVTQMLGLCPLRNLRNYVTSQIAKFMGPTWDPPGTCRPQMGPILAPWTLLSGLLHNVAIQGMATGPNMAGEGPWTDCYNITYDSGYVALCTAPRIDTSVTSSTAVISIEFMALEKCHLRNGSHIRAMYQCDGSRQTHLKIIFFWYRGIDV